MGPRTMPQTLPRTLPQCRSDVRTLCWLLPAALSIALVGCARSTAPGDNREVRSVVVDAGDPQRRAQVRMEMASRFCERQD